MATIPRTVCQRHVMTAFTQTSAEGANSQLFASEEHDPTVTERSLGQFTTTWASGSHSYVDTTTKGSGDFVQNLRIRLEEGPAEHPQRHERRVRRARAAKRIHAAVIHHA
jgi:hypothetical protein